MYLKAIVLLFLLVNTSFEQTSTTAPIPPVCPVFFYIDGSAGQNVIGQQTLLIKTVARSMYATHNWRFQSFIGAFGEFLIGDPDPSSLFDNFSDFLSYLSSLDFSFPSGDDIRSAIDTMNEDSDFGNVLTILFVAAPQATIDGSDANRYKDFTYGVGMIGNLSYDSDDFTTDSDIVSTLIQTINCFCTNFANPQTTSSEQTSTTTPIPPVCPVFFYIDGSAAQTVIGNQTDLIKTLARSMYPTREWRFQSAIGAFGQFLIGDPDPGFLFNTSAEFLASLDLLDFSFPSGDDIKNAIDTMNGDSAFGNVLTILFVAAPQATIDGANTNHYKDFTYGVGMIGNQNLTGLSYNGDDFTDLNIVATLTQAINAFCTKHPKPQTTLSGNTVTTQTACNPSSSSTQELTSTTTTPIPPLCPVFFYIDGSAAQNVIGQQTLLIKTVASSMYATHDWRFQSSIGAFGQFLIGDPDPRSLFDNFPDFSSYLNSIDFSLPSGDDIKYAIDAMNGDFTFGNVLTILFVAAPQTTIDGANDNRYKELTYGVGMIGNQLLTRLSYDSDDFTTDLAIVATLRQAINDFCTKFANSK